MDTKEWTDGLREALTDLVGQVRQAQEGFDHYRNSPSMEEALNRAETLLRVGPSSSIEMMVTDYNSAQKLRRRVELHPRILFSITQEHGEQTIVKFFEFMNEHRMRHEHLETGPGYLHARFTIDNEDLLRQFTRENTGV